MLLFLMMMMMIKKAQALFLLDYSDLCNSSKHSKLGMLIQINVLL